MAPAAWLGRQIRRVSVDTWRAIDRDERPAGTPGADDFGLDLGVMVVLVSAAIGLTVAWYIGGGGFYDTHFPFGSGDDPDAWMARSAWWAALVMVPSCVAWPVLVRACVPGQRAGDLVRAAARLAADWRAPLAVVAAVVPSMYWQPLVEGGGAAAWRWAGGYAVQEAALIVLLFGYGVAVMRPRFGGHAVFVALIPWAMFHYGRPDGQLLGAALAAVLLIGGDVVRPLGGGARLGPALDRNTVTVLLLVAASLTAQEYLGDRSIFEKVLPRATSSRHWYGLYGFGWWAGWRVLGYLIFPALMLLVLPGQRLRDQHLSPRGTIQHLWLYAALFAAVLPAVVLASRTASFQETYPFYKLANRSSTDLWVWESMYAAQFLSLEFFFRGVMLQGLRKVVGSNAIFVMIIPYCMIHYGKPMPETLGAIGAGLILGTLAMRTRSIWGGVMIHMGVAVTMDVLALGHCPPPGHGPCGGAP